MSSVTVVLRGTELPALRVDGVSEVARLSAVVTKCVDFYVKSHSEASIA
jgi:hypothetical protein